MSSGSAVLLLIASLSGLPFESEIPGGVRRVAMSPLVTLEVFTADTSCSTDGFSFEYSVQGLRLVSGAYADTIVWLAGRPGEAFSSALGSGAESITETRTLGILTVTESFIGGVIGVSMTRDGRSSTRYRAYRTWLVSGQPLDIDAVVQRDSLFDSAFRNALGAPPRGNLDSWLWLRGFWLDVQSILVTSGAAGPRLRIGLPSWQGLDSMLVIDLELSELNTAHGAMLD